MRLVENLLVALYNQPLAAPTRIKQQKQVFFFIYNLIQW